MFLVFRLVTFKFKNIYWYINTTATINFSGGQHPINQHIIETACSLWGARSFLISLIVNYLVAIFLRKHSIVFSMRHVMVIGPTPPGTGVITDALDSIAA